MFPREAEFISTSAESSLKTLTEVIKSAFPINQPSAPSCPPKFSRKLVLSSSTSRPTFKLSANFLPTFKPSKSRNQSPSKSQRNNTNKSSTAIVRQGNVLPPCTKNQDRPKISPPRYRLPKMIAAAKTTPRKSAVVPFVKLARNLRPEPNPAAPVTPENLRFDVEKWARQVQSGILAKYGYLESNTRCSENRDKNEENSTNFSKIQSQVVKSPTRTLSTPYVCQISQMVHELKPIVVPPAESNKFSRLKMSFGKEFFAALWVDKGTEAIHFLELNPALIRCRDLVSDLFFAGP